MSAIKSILKEESSRLELLCEKYRMEISKLPKGSISKKERKGHLYSYLAYREGSRVRFEYLGNAESNRVKEIREKIAARKRYEKLLKKAQKNLEELRRLNHERKRKSVS